MVTSSQTPATPPDPNPAQDDGAFALSSHIPSLGGGLRQALFGSILPIATFYIVLTRVNLTAAVLVAATWAITVLMLRWRRTGKVDMFSGVTLGFVTFQSAVGLISQSTEAYLKAPALEGVVWCGVMWGSVIFRRPLIGVIARQFIPIPGHLIGKRPYLWAFGPPTVLWGMVLLGRAGARLVIVDNFSVGEAIVAITVLSWVTSLLALAFSVWYPNRVLRPYLRGDRTV